MVELKEKKQSFLLMEDLFMSKELMLQRIYAGLASMGINTTPGAADVVMNTEFVSAGWSTGNKRIAYEASAFLNEAENTVYFWEMTKETGSGFSFGDSMETSFQTGKTLFRKVKTTQYSFDGKAYEAELDLGAIPKLFKETAQQYGWKYKTVLNKNKAQYQQPQPGFQGFQYQAPQGQTPQYQAPHGQASQYQTPQYQTPQYQAPQYQTPQYQAPQGQEPQYQAPQYGQMPQQNQAYQVNQPPQFNQTTNTNRGNMQSGAKYSALFYIAFVLLALTTAIFLLLGGNTLAGWGIEAVLLLSYFFIGRGFLRKGCLPQLVTFVVAVIVLLLGFSFTVPSNKLEDKSGNTGTQQSQVQQNAADLNNQTSGNAETAAFKIDYLFFEMWPGMSFEGGSGSNTSLSMLGDITLNLSANLAAVAGDKVKTISMSMKPMNQPSAGKVNLYRFRQELAAPPNTPEDMKKYSLPESFDVKVADTYSEAEKPENYLITFVNDNYSGQIRIYYCINDIMSLNGVKWEDAIAAAKAKGITSDSLRTKVAVTLDVEMQSGQKHRIYFERDFMPGDFFKEKDRVQVTEDYQGKESKLISKKVD